MEETNPLCLYCQQAIDSDEVFGLELVAGLFRSPTEGQLGQQFWCHLPCFRESVPPDSRWLFREEFGGPDLS